MGATCAGTCSTTCPSSTSCPESSSLLRYIADGDYPSSRIAATSPFEQVGNLVNYLVGDPVQQTHDDFMALGSRLSRDREVSRVPAVAAIAACLRYCAGIRLPKL